jgi:ABC-2 type transport system permease protein
MDLRPIIEESGAWSVTIYETRDKLLEAVSGGEVLLGVAFDGAVIEYSYQEGDLSQRSTITMAQSSISAAVEKKINDAKTVIVLEKIPRRPAGRRPPMLTIPCPELSPSPFCRQECSLL